MYSILVDITKCTGCEKCVDVCIDVNNLDKNKADYDRAISKDGLSENRFLSIIGLNNGKFARKSCMHCVEPSCVSACLVRGITKTKEGPVVYDPNKCIGCRYCMLSCPFHIPRYEWNTTKPFIKKCNMCYDKLQEGKTPKCVEVCPNNALIFGERKLLIEKAEQIIKDNKPKYKEHIWGKDEFGGTSILYISDVNLDSIIMPEEAKFTIPELTEPLIEKTPIMGLGVATGLIGLNWIIKRRNQLSKNDSKIIGKNQFEDNENDK